MGLSWQQGPLSPAPVGRFLAPRPLPERLLFAERLRRRMRVQFGGDWVVDSEDVLLLHEPGRYPVAYFPRDDISAKLRPTPHRTDHRDLGATAWFDLDTGTRTAERAAWEHVSPPAHATDLADRLAFRWSAMDAFYEEDERILGHAADPYHRIDIRATSRRLLARVGERVVADSKAPLVLYETGFTPRWYVPRTDVDASALTPTGEQTFCPYKGLADSYDVAGQSQGAWSYPDPYAESARIAGHVCFYPERVGLSLDGKPLQVEEGQPIVTGGDDRDLTAEEPLAPRPAGGA